MKMNKATLIGDKGQICFTHFEVTNNGNILTQQFRTPLFTIKGKGVIKKICFDCSFSNPPSSGTYSDEYYKRLDHLFIADERIFLKCDLYKVLRHNYNNWYTFQINENISFDTSFEIISLGHRAYSGFIEYVIYE